MDWQPASPDLTLLSLVLMTGFQSRCGWTISSANWTRSCPITGFAASRSCILQQITLPDEFPRFCFPVLARWISGYRMIENSSVNWKRTAGSIYIEKWLEVLRSIGSPIFSEYHVYRSSKVPLDSPSSNGFRLCHFSSSPKPISRHQRGSGNEAYRTAMTFVDFPLYWLRNRIQFVWPVERSHPKKAKDRSWSSICCHPLRTLWS